MENTTYTYHHDAGHGWLEVDFGELLELNIAGDISGCSYRKGDTVFLEEDCDMTEFFNAYELKLGKKPKTAPENDGDWIRELPYYELSDFKSYINRSICNLEREMDGTRDNRLINQLACDVAELWELMEKIA